jgi:putative transposase
LIPNYRHPDAEGLPVFFTVALADRGANTLPDRIDALREAVRITRAERPFGIEARVVLPDHLHCIWRLPEGDRDYPTRWRLIKARFSMGMAKGPLRASHVSSAERGVWQRRYWEHHCRSEEDLAAHVRYCWWNPVKHGFVERPDEWAWSSVHGEGRYPQGACLHEPVARTA